MSTTQPDTADALSERVVALLRTAVPALWGTLTAWLLAQVAGVLPPALADPLATALGSDVVVAVVVAAVIATWYAVWRWAEPHVPAWLVRVVLGSARTPTYAPVLDDGTPVITSLSQADRNYLEQLRDVLSASDSRDPVIGVLDRVLQV